MTEDVDGSIWAVTASPRIGSFALRISGSVKRCRPLNCRPQTRLLLIRTVVSGRPYERWLGPIPKWPNGILLISIRALAMASPWPSCKFRRFCLAATPSGVVGWRNGRVQDSRCGTASLAMSFIPSSLTGKLRLALRGVRTYCDPNAELQRWWKSPTRRWSQTP